MVFVELMQLWQALRLRWLVRWTWFCVHADVNATARAMQRESHNCILGEDPKAFKRKIDQRYQLSGTVFRYPPIKRGFS
jgi:hypothetical protein